MKASNKNYTIVIVNQNGETEAFFKEQFLPNAKKLAKEQASLHADKSVYITRYRKADGQEMYYNRDGYSPIGKSW